MARIIVERSHTLGLATAREKAEVLAAKMASKFGAQTGWEGDVLAIKRSGADGRIEVGEDNSRVQLELNMLFSAMGGEIRSQIERALDKALQA